jgi:hypothetical protein
MKKLSLLLSLLIIAFSLLPAKTFALEGQIDVGDFSKHWIYYESSNTRYSSAKSYCKQMNYRLPTIKELEQIYTMTLDSNNNSLLRGNNKSISIWSSNAGVTIDAVVLLNVAAIPFPEYSHKSLNIYKYQQMKTEVAYDSYHRFLLEGKAKVICIEN